MGRSRIARSHGRDRIEPSQIRDVRAPRTATSAPSTRDHRPYRAARRHLLAALTARVDHGVASALAGHATPEIGAEIARHALSLYRGGVLELQTASPIACSHLVRWAVGTAVSQHLALAAADAGPRTAEGRALLELSMRLEGRAERASVAAAAFAREFAPVRRQRTVLDEIEADAARALAARRGGGS